VSGQTEIRSYQCFAFYPFLWAAEGDVATSSRSPVPALEALNLKTEFRRQIAGEYFESRG
jgi:hypothetical protein